MFSLYLITGLTGLVQRIYWFSIWIFTKSSTNNDLTWRWDILRNFSCDNDISKLRFIPVLSARVTFPEIIHLILWSLEGLHKGFWDTTKKSENINLIFISIQLSEMHGTGGTVELLLSWVIRVATQIFMRQYKTLKGFKAVLKQFWPNLRKHFIPK